MASEIFVPKGKCRRRRQVELTETVYWVPGRCTCSLGYTSEAGEALFHQNLFRLVILLLELSEGFLVNSSWNNNSKSVQQNPTVDIWSPQESDQTSSLPIISTQFIWSSLSKKSISLVQPRSFLIPPHRKLPAKKHTTSELWVPTTCICWSWMIRNAIVSLSILSLS